MQYEIIQNTSPAMTALLGVMQLLFGGFLLTHESRVSLGLFVTAGVVLLLVAGVREALALLEVDNRKGAVMTLGIFVLEAVLLVVFSQLFVGMVELALAVMFFLLALLRLLICVHMLVSGVPGFLNTFLSLVLSIGLGVTFAFASASEKNDMAMLVLGIYLIVAGINQLGIFLSTILGSDLVDDRTRRRVYFTLPNVLTIPMTLQILRRCGKYLEEHPQDKTVVEEQEDTAGKNLNLEILVHTSRRPGKQLGHVDICLEDKIYTFGNYDASTHRMGGFVAEGIFAVLPREPYLQLCLNDQQKYIIGYGCTLSEVQLEAVHRKIAEIYACTEAMDVDITKEDARGADGVVAFAKLGGDVRRVVKGNFKTYFLIASNCVKLADTIVGAAGLERISRGAMVTPGAYLCMLDNLFFRKNTRVVRRTTYLQP